MNKFEKLVEFIINEDEEKAQELFHEIVVEKSREIYNDLVNESEDQTDDFVADIEADEYGTDMHAEDEKIKEFGWDRGHIHPMIKMMVRAGYTGGLGNKGIYDFWKDVLSKW